MSNVTHDKHDETTGKFAAEYSAEDFVDAVSALDLPTTSDVADAVGCAHRTALHHLNRLAEEGRLDSRMAGRAKLWRVVEDSQDAGVAPDAGTEAVTPDRTREGAHAVESAESDVVDIVADIDIPKSVDRDAAAAAVTAAREYIRDHDGATMGEIVAEVMPAHPLKYDADEALAKVNGPDRYRGGWWRHVIKPSLETLPDIEKPPRGGSTWKPRDAE